MHNPEYMLFNNKTIEKLCENISINENQRNNAYIWLELLKSGKLNKEEKNYINFARRILENVLGYPADEELEFENNVEFSYWNRSSGKSICIEAKGLKTKDLFAPQYREKKEHTTPVKQTWDYMGQLNCDYGITTNYRHFVLIDKTKGYSKYHYFDFHDIENNDLKLKEFIGIFGKDNLLESDFINYLFNESILEQREFTKEFYKLYHETRLMMIKEFQSNGNSKLDAIHYAQLILNRLIFIFFAEDNEKIRKRFFSESILQILNPLFLHDNSHIVFDIIKELFNKLNKGSKKPIEIIQFNGGLFMEDIPFSIIFNDFKERQFYEDVLQYSQLKTKMSLDDYSKSILSKFGDSINPIIYNLLIMSSFDFNSDINVNILGHIFEQSLSDIDELKENQGVTTRRRDGIYYTPDYITDYICRNTIIPFLSEKGTNDIFDLIEEYYSNIELLETKFKNVKILDPACGSGAFLIKAIDILLEIYKQIQYVKQFKGQYTRHKQTKEKKIVEEYTLSNWIEQEEITKIIENNIYGVDINEESIEITKLSLFLKIASTERKLLDLYENIKVGNSIIDDIDVDTKAFIWDKEFEEILTNGGFDVIIGNPPYVRQERIKSFSNFLKKYESYSGKADLYVYFYEKCIKLLRKGGYLGLISSSKFTEALYGKPLLKFITSNIKINEFIYFDDKPIFEDVTAYPLIFIGCNIKVESYFFIYKKIIKNDKEPFNFLNSFDLFDISIEEFKIRNFRFLPGKIGQIFDRISDESKPLKVVVGLPQVGIKTGYNNAFVTNNKSDFVMPYVFGKDIKRYTKVEPKINIVFPYKYVENSYKLIDIEKYKDVKNLLVPYKDLLEKRAIIKEGIIKGNKKWFEYQQINRNLNFDKEYIIYPNVSFGSNFSLSKGKIVDMTAFIIPTNNRFILGILNSKLIEFFMKYSAITRRGGYKEYKTQYVENIPIKKITKEKKYGISTLVEDILTNQNNLDNIKERIIDQINFKFKPTDNITIDFDNMNNISEILEKITKKTSTKLNPIQKDEWIEYFFSMKDKIIAINEKLDKLYRELDAMIFDIYELTKEEVEFIHEDLKD
jgi:hypothetical protein